MATMGRDPEYDRLAEEIIEAISALITKRIGRFTTDDGRVRMGTQSTIGTLPPSRGGWRDHAHDGTDAQQLAEANTHQALDTDPDTAIHWTREMIQDMVADFLEDQDGNPFAYNHAGDKLAIESGTGSAWGVLTDGTGGPNSIVFDSFGQVVMVEFPR